MDEVFEGLHRFPLSAGFTLDMALDYSESIQEQNRNLYFAIGILFKKSAMKRGRAHQKGKRVGGGSPASKKVFSGKQNI